MSELYHMKLEADALRQAKAEVQAQCVHLERVVEQIKAEAKQEAVRMILSLLMGFIDLVTLLNWILLLLLDVFNITIGRR